MNPNPTMLLSLTILLGICTALLLVCVGLYQRALGYWKAEAKRADRNFEGLRNLALNRPASYEPDGNSEEPAHSAWVAVRSLRSDHTALLAEAAEVEKILASAKPQIVENGETLKKMGSLLDQMTETLKKTRDGFCKCGSNQAILEGTGYRCRECGELIPVKSFGADYSGTPPAGPNRVHYGNNDRTL